MTDILGGMERGDLVAQSDDLVHIVLEGVDRVSEVVALLRMKMKGERAVQREARSAV